jgi:hypothetical protein
MKSLSFLILTLLAVSFLISPILAADDVPEPWDGGVKVYLPHNTSEQPGVRIANSTYLIHFDPGFPVDWFTIIVTLTFIFFFISLYVRQFADLAATLSTVMFFILAYMAQFLTYNKTSTVLYSDYVVVIPVTEVFRLDWLSYVLLLFAFISLIWTIKLYWDYFRESAEAIDKAKHGFTNGGRRGF